MFVSNRFHEKFFVVVGRSYLAQNPLLMRSLMDNLRADDRDSLTRENVLGCLQKLSLR